MSIIEINKQNKKMQNLYFGKEEFPSSLSKEQALPLDNNIRFSVSLKEKIYSSLLEIYRDSDGKKFFFDMFASGYNEFSLIIDANSLCENGGLFFYVYHLETENGKRDIRCSYESCEEYISDFSDSVNDYFQLTIYKQTNNYPSWFEGGNMYHIFIDRFYSSGKNQIRDGQVKYDWEQDIPEYPEYPGAFLRNNGFFGGDLNGIVEKLDYLSKLGISCIYLSPVVESPSNHKYDTANYLSVDSAFGGEEALSELIKKAHEKNIKIVLDGVFNHTGADSIYFNRYGNYAEVGAYQSKSSKYYDWFDFKEFPNKYTCWWDIEILPRVNSDNESYRNYLFSESGVISKYFKMGIDGMRLDVADELSDNFLKELKQTTLKYKKDSLVIGEVWEDASNKIAYSTRKKYFQGNELDSVMNYPLRTAIISYIKYGNYKFFKNTANAIYSHYPSVVKNSLMNLLGTHDTSRILTELVIDDCELSNKEKSTFKLDNDQYSLAKNRLKIAYIINAMLPGVPCIYYGDEIGMEGFSDPFNRMPYKWGKEDKEIQKLFFVVNKIRTDNFVFTDGDFNIDAINENILVISRIKEDEMIVSVVNRSNEKYNFTCDNKMKILLSSSRNSGNQIELDSYGYCIMKFKMNSKVELKFGDN